jgi:protein-S-isoprenylcysteine O-methyltransferase Ste14
VTEGQSKQGGARVRVPPPLVFLGWISAGVLLDRLVTPELASGLIPRLCGVVLILVGLGLGGWSVGLFKSTGQNPVPWKPSPTLIMEGPYRFTRNPMYVGMAAVQIGIGLCAGNAWILGLAAVALLFVHFTAVRPEEEYLSARFGQDYERYKKTVRRYL